VADLDGVRVIFADHAVMHCDHSKRIVDGAARGSRIELERITVDIHAPSSVENAAAIELSRIVGKRAVADDNCPTEKVIDAAALRLGHVVGERTVADTHESKGVVNTAPIGS